MVERHNEDDKESDIGSILVFRSVPVAPHIRFEYEAGDDANILANTPVLLLLVLTLLLPLVVEPPLTVVVAVVSTVSTSTPV